MNKKVIAAAVVALAGIFSSNAFAQQAVENNKKCSDKTECTRGKGVKHDKMNVVSPFEGLNLNEQQQKQLDELHATRTAEVKAAKEARKAEKEKAKEARKAQFKARKADYLAKVKAILTPEQYVKFLENQYTKVKAEGKKMKGDFKKDKKAAEMKMKKMAQHKGEGRQRADRDKK